MEDLFTLHIKKIAKVIKSCKTDEHLLCAKKVINNFVNYWGYKPVKIQTYLTYFSVLYNHQKRVISE
jgi:hypothetical protein